MYLAHSISWIFAKWVKTAFKKCVASCLPAPYLPRSTEPKALVFRVKRGMGKSHHGSEGLKLREVSCKKWERISQGLTEKLLTGESICLWFESGRSTGNSRVCFHCRLPLYLWGLTWTCICDLLHANIWQCPGPQAWLVLWGVPCLCAAQHALLPPGQVLCTQTAFVGEEDRAWSFCMANVLTTDLEVQQEDWWDSIGKGPWGYRVASWVSGSSKVQKTVTQEQLCRKVTLLWVPCPSPPRELHWPSTMQVNVERHGLMAGRDKDFEKTVD
jgi:hypothetical protein